MNLLLTLIAFLIITNGVLALMVIVTAPLASKYQKIRGMIFQDYMRQETYPDGAGMVYYKDAPYPAVTDYYRHILKIEGKNPDQDPVEQIRKIQPFPGGINE